MRRREALKAAGLVVALVVACLLLGPREKASVDEGPQDPPAARARNTGRPELFAAERPAQPDDPDGLSTNQRSPARVGITIRSVRTPTGAKWDWVHIAAKAEGSKAWVQCAELEWLEDLPVSITKRGPMRIGLLGPNGSYWISDVLESGTYALDVTLHPGLELAGRVLTQSGGGPAAGAELCLEELPEFMGVDADTEQFATADDAGRFQFKGLVPGTYTLSAQAAPGRSNDGGFIEHKVRAGVQNLEIKLAGRGILTLRIVDERGRLLEPKTDLSLFRAFGIARLPSRYESHMDAWRVDMNPIELVFDPDEVPQLNTIFAFADGYEPSRPFEITTMKAGDFSTVDLVVRSKRHAHVQHTFHLEFTGPHTPTEVRLSRAVGSWNRTERYAIKDGAIFLDLLPLQAGAMTISPMLGAARHVTWDRRAFDASSNPHSSQQVSWRTGAAPPSHVRFPMAGGVRLMGAGLHGTPLGSFTRAGAVLKVQFHQALDATGTARPVSAPMPSGTWALFLPSLNPTERLVAQVEIMSGRITEVHIDELWNRPQ